MSSILSSLILTLVSLLFLFGCDSLRSKRELTHFSQQVMTIDYHISVGDSLSGDKKKQIQQTIDATFQEIDAIYNKWNPHSELSVLNRLPAKTPCSLSPQLYEFLQRLDIFVQLSGGRFDPTIEPLQQLWTSRMEKGRLPSLSEIEVLRPCIGWHTLHFADGMFYKDDSRTQLDLGGVAKGLAVDLLLERLHRIGLNHLYVEWGGEIRTLGFHPSKRPWHVYISRLANADPAQAIAHLNLTDHALATSGDYFQCWKVVTEQGEEKIFCHIFNPLTLRPIELRAGSVASASLLALDCVMADALAKVLMLFDSAVEAEGWLKNLQKEYPYLAAWVATRE